MIRKLVSVVCLLALSAAAQQSNNQVGLVPVMPAADGQSGSAPAQQPSGTPPDAPKPQNVTPQNLPPALGVDYSKPVRLFPNPFARYIPRDIPPPVVTNAPRLGELVQNGKIMLSLNDAIAIALVDNLDIAVARYTLPIADTDILRTKAGGSFLGVLSGVVSNTPGGTGTPAAGVSGAGAGGTTAGAGGAGGGAGGVNGNTAGAGPGTPNFDPVLTANLSLQRAQSPQATTFLTGSSLLLQNSGQVNFGYSQGFAPGTNLSVTLNNARQTSNNLRNALNPILTSSFQATVTQHLLQGFGTSVNTRLITEAKNNKKGTEEAFKQQVISTVSQIENIYWDLVNAFEDYRVKERSLGLAQKTLSDNQKQVEIGTLAPLDVVRAQSSVASAEQDLIVSRTNLQTQELFMKNALTRSLPNDSQVMQLDIIPTDTVDIPAQENLPAVEELIKLALANNPGYRQQLIALQNSQIDIRAINNSLLPQVDLFAFYGASAVAGPVTPAALCPAGVTPSAANPCILPGTIPGGFTDAFGNLFNSSGPNKGIGLTLTIPLGNRIAQATQIRSRLAYRQSQLGLKSLENQIAIFVRQDAFTVEQNRARVGAAQKAQVLAQQTLDAEQKKYNLGASTYLNVLSDERDLAQAESNLVSTKINYAKSKVQLDRDTAQTLDRLNIVLDEAVTGAVRTQPVVPGAVPNVNALQDLTGPQKPPQQNPPPKP
jgi:outer membrane protein TolC